MILFQSFNLDHSQAAEPKKTNSARKLPENPETVNPVMIINQMCPQAVFEELEAVGQPPKITFAIRLTIDNHVFEGIGA